MIALGEGGPPRRRGPQKMAASRPAGTQGRSARQRSRRRLHGGDGRRGSQEAHHVRRDSGSRGAVGAVPVLGDRGAPGQPARGRRLAGGAPRPGGAHVPAPAPAGCARAARLLDARALVLPGPRRPGSARRAGAEAPRRLRARLGAVARARDPPGGAVPAAPPLDGAAALRQPGGARQDAAGAGGAAELPDSAPGHAGPGMGAAPGAGPADGRAAARRSAAREPGGPELRGESRPRPLAYAARRSMRSAEPATARMAITGSELLHILRQAWSAWRSRRRGP